MAVYTLAQALQELEGLKHRRAVWMETVEHLSRFVDREGRKADQAVMADGCVEDTVPQGLISEFIAELNKSEIDPLNQRIDAIENLYVMETKNGEPEEEDSSEKVTGKPATQKANQGQKTGTVSRRIRTISGGHGRKAQ